MSEQITSFSLFSASSCREVIACVCAWRRIAGGGGSRRSGCQYVCLEQTCREKTLSNAFYRLESTQLKSVDNAEGES